MSTTRRRLRAVLFRTGMQVGWLWLAAVAWLAVIGLPDGRWNRRFDGRAIATITSIHGEVGAEDPDLLVEYVFRANGREYKNHGIDVDRPRDVDVGSEVEVAYVTADPRYSELRVPGVRSRYQPVSRDLLVTGLFALVGILVIAGDLFAMRRDARQPAESHAAVIEERKPPAIWFLFVLPAATLAAVATLAIRFYC